jgi:hypothetical protein
MATQNTQQEQQTAPINQVAMSSQAYPSDWAYHELSDVPVQAQDPLMQLQENLKLLADLQGRLSFAMREIRYLMKV